MFQIKICGIKSAADAKAAVDAGADAVGLNFYPRSSRYVSPDQAAEVAAAIPSSVLKVGVFVNAAIDQVLSTCDALPLDVVQLHGDEPPSFLRGLESRRVMKAFRLGPEGLEPIRRWLEATMNAGLAPHRVLLDAHRAGQYGGTGETADWNVAAAYSRTAGIPALVLAGGLTPENVGTAIEMVRPAAVDTAGGVESSPGVKDAARMQRFCAAARAAFEQANRS